MDELPRAAHPTAKAFFDALDQYNGRREGINEDEGMVKNKDGFNKRFSAIPKDSPSMSSTLKRKSQSLGWRNRHSQSEYYPVTILQSPNTSTLNEDLNPGSNRLRSRNFSVQQVQRGEVEGTHGTGATVWPAAMVLIKYLEHNNSYGVHMNKYSADNKVKTDKNCNPNFVVSLKGKHVIDLGAGTGVTSIASALLGAASVVCTDGEETVVRLARSNIRRACDQLSVSLCSSYSNLTHQGSEMKPKTEKKNLSICAIGEEKMISSTVNTNDSDISDTVIIDDCTIRAEKYWWGDGTYRDIMSCRQDNGLVILVADCVLPKLYPIAPLVQAIDECLREHDDNNKKYDRQILLSENSSSFAILSYEHRYYPDYDPKIEFRRLAIERCLDVYTVPRDEMDPVYSLEDVEIWIVRRYQEDNSS